MNTRKRLLSAAALLAALALSPMAEACSPGLPNYGNCVRQQQEA